MTEDEVDFESKLNNVVCFIKFIIILENIKFIFFNIMIFEIKYE